MSILRDEIITRLEEQIQSLQKQNEVLQSQLDLGGKLHADALAIIDDLQRQNELMRECLEFYASKNNWCGYGGECETIIEDKEKSDNGVTVGGKRARSCLEQVKEMAK